MDTPINILMLEDTDSDAKLLLKELQRIQLKFNHKMVNNREAFVAALSEFKPDLILSDYALPSFDGLSAYHVASNFNPEVPFIIVSGTIGEENAVELIKNGVTDYAMKDKLYVIGSKIARALKDARERAVKQKEGERLKIQHQRLMEIAFLQSHQVRRPIASILGLIELFDPEDQETNKEIVSRLKQAALELDEVVKEVVIKTEEIMKK
jgi:DNA-binding NtrC family response regulator